MYEFCLHCDDKSLRRPEQGGRRQKTGGGDIEEKKVSGEWVLGISDAVLIWQSLWVCFSKHHPIKKFLMLSVISLFQFWGLLTCEDIIIIVRYVFYVHANTRSMYHRLCICFFFFNCKSCSHISFIFTKLSTNLWVVVLN